MDRSTRRGFTLVELLVVIAIIGILVSLLLPAVQAARESGRRTQCSNNIRNLGLGCQQHLEAQRWFPTGGWGFAWVGNPDKGYGRGQPGGWIFNILPNIEQEAIYRLQLAKEDADRPKAAKEMISTPLPLLNCPTRRSAVTYPAATAYWHQKTPLIGGKGSPGSLKAASTDRVARADYAANGGEAWIQAPEGALHNGSGPKDYASGIGSDYMAKVDDRVRQFSGIVGVMSQTRDSDIRDGLSNTLLLGEKYLDPHFYLTGEDSGDNENMYMGTNTDIERFTGLNYRPMQDRRGVPDPYRFGSAHPNGFNVVFCDGSTHTLNFSIDPETFRRLGHRADLLPVMLDNLQ